MAEQGFLMEVCVDSVESAVNAERGGAGRIELCASLLEGGITPTIGLLQIVKQYVQIPVFVMIRPRGGDFLYSDREVEVMKADIRLAKIHGADGLVFGALTEDGRIDTELCMDLLAVSRPLPVTFHRAFDMVYDPLLAMETLISLGFERVLTSGCDSSALEGLPLIKRLVEQAKGRIIVMPGGGITERNLHRILEGTGVEEFHCSARSTKESLMKYRNHSVCMGATITTSEYAIKVADVAKVRTLNAMAKISCDVTRRPLGGAEAVRLRRRSRDFFLLKLCWLVDTSIGGGGGTGLGGNAAAYWVLVLMIEGLDEGCGSLISITVIVQCVDHIWAHKYCDPSRSGCIVSIKSFLPFYAVFRILQDPQIPFQSPLSFSKEYT
ncbi:copper homeostasis protein cutC homolog isoform X2 [Aquarana catesbeiana]